MLKEALDALVDLGRKSAAPMPVYEDAYVKKVVIDGRVEEIVKIVPPRGHNAGDLGEIIALANRFHDDALSPVVWFDEASVVLVVDDAGHRVNVIEFPLNFSDQFKTLEDLRARKPMLDQKAFVRLLRIDLAGTLDPGELLNHVRKVTFRSDATATGTVTRKEESMGRHINSELVAGDAIPETVRLAVAVYNTSGEGNTYGLLCAVEVHHDERRFQLFPLPDEIERVQQAAMASIRERLADGLTEGILAYYGQP